MFKSSATIETLRHRAKLIQKIRQFFYHKNILEVETPIVSNFASVDLNLDSFISQYEIVERPIHPVYLQTSPEFHMKRLLASGSGSIFQLTKAFRNGESGKRHNPEFSILEWYRINFTMNDLILEVSELVNTLLGQKTFHRFTYEQIFIDILNVNPLDAPFKELQGFITDPDLKNALSSRDEVLDFLFTHFIEPKLKRFERVFICNYPKSQAALAKINSDDPRTSSRFELYLNGLEICNGFHELTDPIEQLERFKDDNNARKLNGKQELPYDKYLLEALKEGMPECSGVAVGLDRLLMIALNKETINDVIAFPFERA